jgi:hypothetical protein
MVSVLTAITLKVGMIHYIFASITSKSGIAVFSSEICYTPSNKTLENGPCTGEMLDLQPVVKAANRFAAR